MWHISIPERRTRTLFFRYPLYRNSERNRSIRTATPAPQRSLAIALQQPSPAPRPLQPPSAAHAHRAAHFASVPALKSFNATKI